MLNIQKNPKYSPIFILTIGTLFSNLLPILIQPILTRLITPEELGIYNVVISLANLIIPVASLKLYQLIVTVEDDKEAKRLTQISINTVMLTSSLYLGSIIILTPFNTTFTELGVLSYLIPLIVFFDGLFYVLNSYFNRYKNYKLMAESDISRGVFRGVFQVIFAIIKWNSFGQIVSHILSPIPFLIRAIKKLDKENFSSNRVGFIETITSYKIYSKQILFTVPGQFINSFSYTLILLSVTALYSTKQIGYYSISVKLLGIPMVLVSANVARLYLQKMSETKNSGNAPYVLYKRILRLLSLISFILFGSLAIAAPFVSEFIFGKGYDEAGIYISILSVMFIFRFVTSSLSGTYVIYNVQYREVFFQIALIIVGVLVYLITFYLSLNIYLYFLLISISYALVYLWMLFDMTVLVKNKEK